MWKFLEKRPFSGRIWPDWGNTAQADMAGLGSIGLNMKNREYIHFRYRKVSNWNTDLSLGDVALNPVSQ